MALSRSDTNDSGPALVMAAMPQEAAAFTERMIDPVPLPCPLTEVNAVRGELAGTDTVVVTSGIGIAAASAAATWAILEVDPDVVIAAGSCGGLAADIEVGTVVLGTAFAYSIADATAFGYAPGQVPGSPEQFLADADLVTAAEHSVPPVLPPSAPALRSGLMLAGDAFVTSELAEPMRKRFPGALSADMETTATARTAHAFAVPMLALRAVSDLCGPRADQQFHIELAQAAELSAIAVHALLGSASQLSAARR